MNYFFLFSYIYIRFVYLLILQIPIMSLINNIVIPNEFLENLGLFNINSNLHNVEISHMIQEDTIYLNKIRAKKKQELMKDSSDEFIALYRHCKIISDFTTENKIEMETKELLSILKDLCYDLNIEDDAFTLSECLQYWDSSYEYDDDDDSINIGFESWVKVENVWVKEY